MVDDSVVYVINLQQVLGLSCKYLDGANVLKVREQRICGGMRVG